jgi:predicted nucleic-acid-binding protein
MRWIGRSTTRSKRAVIAVDTNVVVRLLVADDKRQAVRARRLFEAESVALPKTVVLETEWVLRRLYDLDRRRVLDALTTLIALPNVHCEDEEVVRCALGWALKGLDLADALHLASSAAAERFVSFDRRLAKRAKAAAVGIAVEPP